MYIALSILVLLSVVCWSYFLKRRVSHAESRDIFIDHFYKCSTTLIEENDVPDDVCEILCVLSENLNNRRIIREIFFDIVLGRAKSESLVEGKRKFDNAVLTMREPLQKIFYEAIGSALMAMTLNSAIIGTIMRRMVLLGMSVTDRTKDASADENGKIVALDIVSHAKHAA